MAEFFFVSLGSVVLMLLGTEEGRIFFSLQNERKKSYFFLPPPVRKTGKVRELWLAAFERGDQSTKRKLLLKVGQIICMAYSGRTIARRNRILIPYRVKVIQMKF